MESRLNLALIGATGGTGSQILHRALARGHAVRALVRNPDKLAASFPDAQLPAALTVQKGDATSEADVARLLADAKVDALVFAVGTSSLDKNTICISG